MPWSRPTLQQLVDRSASDVQAQLVGTDARLRRSLLTILSRMHAGGMHGLYGFLQRIQAQLFVDTAEKEFLDRHATEWGVQRLAATYAQGSVTVTASTDTTILDGTLVQRSDEVLFRVLGDTPITAPSGSVQVRAIVAGAGGNTEAGSTLTFVSPVAGVASEADVGVDGITDGTDIEDDESLRGRVLQYMRQRPGVGTKADYERWAREVAGVTRAWCFPLEGGPGFVKVRFMRDNDADPIPGSGEVAAVQAHIDAVRPVRGTVTVVAPIADALNPHILLTPDTPATRAAVVAQLNDLLLREASPGGTVPLTHIQTAIDEAAGVTDYSLLSPTSNVTTATGHITTLGTPTWT